MFPLSFTENITGAFGAEGRAWLAALPGLLQECARQWDLTLLQPLNGAYNYVTLVRRRDGATAVLKAGVLPAEYRPEITALRLYDGRGAARLLEADEARGCFLIEHVEPGTMLGALEDDEAATRAAVAVMAALWRPLPPGHPFPDTRRYMRSLIDDERRDRCARFLPRAVLDNAAALARELLDAADTPVLLHGDLHQWNILQATRSPWLAIDPKGIAGEPAYEPGALLRNPMPDVLARPDFRKLTERRLDIICERLGFDRRRQAAWAWVQGVLSACWDVEDLGRGVGEYWRLVETLEVVWRAA